MADGGGEVDEVEGGGEGGAARAAPLSYDSCGAVKPQLLKGSQGADGGGEGGQVIAFEAKLYEARQRREDLVRVR